MYLTSYVMLLRRPAIAPAEWVGGELRWYVACMCDPVLISTTTRKMVEVSLLPWWDNASSTSRPRPLRARLVAWGALTLTLLPRYLLNLLQPYFSSTSAIWPTPVNIIPVKRLQLIHTTSA